MAGSVKSEGKPEEVVITPSEEDVSMAKSLAGAYLVSLGTACNQPITIFVKPLVELALHAISYGRAVQRGDFDAQD